jgi:DNA-binding transcriptional ArsR family regulator
MVGEPLDSFPIAPPLVRSKPKGRPVFFEDLLATAGMRNVLTLPRTPEICLHGGAYDFKVPASKGPIYCISGATLPADPYRRAREVMRRLAYGFNDYAAREVVSRYHRDIIRSRKMTDPLSDKEARAVKSAFTKSALRIKRILRARGEATVGEIARATGMAQPNVCRTIADMISARVVKATSTYHGLAIPNAASKSLFCTRMLAGRPILRLCRPRRGSRDFSVDELRHD